MDNVSIKLEIGDFLGFCDLNGVEALQTEQIQRLEELIGLCNDGLNRGEELVTNAIWDKLMEILRKVNPDSELCKQIWEDSVDELDDTDAIVRSNPMYSIQTVKSFDCDELKAFIDRLPSGQPFDAHISVKLNGHGIRLKYQHGNFFCARSRARASAGRDITPQLTTILQEQGLLVLDELEEVDLFEIRGEWVLPFYNLDRAREFNKDIISAFSGVSSMGKASASTEEWGLLRFVAYEFLAEGVNFDSKDDEYQYLSDLGFETPLSWVIDGITKESLLDDIKQIVLDCEEEIKPDDTGENGYDYYTDGLVFSINDTNFFRQLGDDGGHYKYGNMALKVGYWKQDMYSGYVQTILWTKGKTKLSPVAIVAEVPDIIEFEDYGEHPYIQDKKEIKNWDKLGVVTASGNKVRRVPLYEPNNMLMLDAYRGNVLYFRYGGEAGVVPCFEDGKTLVDGRVKQLLADDDYDYDGFYYE